MSNEIAIPRGGDIESNHAHRLGEMERRVLVMGDEPPDEGGCCTVLCCNDNPLQDRTTGQTGTYCTVDLEESPGAAVRLAVNGFVVVQARATGVVQFDVTVNVEGTNYLERATWRQTLDDSDIVSVPFTNTIDVNITSPSVSVVVRNLGTPTIRILAVVNQVLVYGVREGSTACGETAGTG